ncbi:MAG TPA: TIGR02281 family clan AA aspartic protease [Cellvibrionaceae bacterium]|nr:TIGR02281 family clan AA aspartic protease [Cellvibrionaceae bacterium]
MVMRRVLTGFFCGLVVLSAPLARADVDDDIVPVNAAKKNAAPVEVVPLGLFNNSAVVKINGHERILRQGKTSPEGATLISANARSAEGDINGQRQTRVLNRGVGTRFSAPPIAEARIASQVNGHYFTPGRINNQNVEFLVDTGATTIAINATTADKLGLEYSKDKPVGVQTAQGMTNAYPVVLNSASVGNVTLNNIEALVLEGEYPTAILLGNSFLSRVDLKVEQGVMVLQSKY